MCKTIFESSPPSAADAVAAALAEGIDPSDVGEAIALAANQLVLRDAGRPERWASPGKPPGSVHGDSIGVHASDAVNAWRNMARVVNPRNAAACLILAGYEVARDRQARAADFLKWTPRPLAEVLEAVKTTDPKGLLAEAESAIQANQQEIASALVHRYGALGHDPAPVFALLLKYAVSEDGALHAEKYYNTVREEFASTRPAFRWRQLVALARVTASECGRPAPGYRPGQGAAQGLTDDAPGAGREPFTDGTRRRVLRRLRTNPARDSHRSQLLASPSGSFRRCDAFSWVS